MAQRWRRSTSTKRTCPRARRRIRPGSRAVMTERPKSDRIRGWLSRELEQRSSGGSGGVDSVGPGQPRQNRGARGAGFGRRRSRVDLGHRIRARRRSFGVSSSGGGARSSRRRRSESGQPAPSGRLGGGPIWGGGGVNSSSMRRLPRARWRASQGSRGGGGPIQGGSGRRRQSKKTTSADPAQATQVGAVSDVGT